MPISIALQSLDEARALCGPGDRNLTVLRERFGVGIYNRQGTLRIEGAHTAAEKAASVLESLLKRLRDGEDLSSEHVSRMLGDAEESAPGRLVGRLGVAPRSRGQHAYVEKLEKHDLTFCIGPAGTGKTFLAIAAAVRGLKDGLYERIVLCRPAVEAGEHLGFLPGDLQAKINPFLRPLYDALYAVLEHDMVKRYQEREVIEVAPLAYMRGRTLRRAFIILDEGQNTTRAQMKMFLTRMGEGSKIVVTGDISQIDLPGKQASGLVHSRQVLAGIEGIGFQEMQAGDIVRHQLVKKIVAAYDRNLGSNDPRDRG